ncbi:MAG: phosphoglycerate dehydrogenase [Nitrospinae bacterium]|nr:phosphoglycerate dehydrogenase [Nitrospinota bacterium]
MKVLVSDELSEKGIEIFKREREIELEVKIGLSIEDLIAEIPDYDALVIRSGTKVTAEVIEAGDNLKVIGRAGIGVDNIDIDAASKRGIVVMNTPEGNIITTAEHTISMMLALSRNIPQANAYVKSKKWKKKGFIGVEVFNKTLGVIGLGRIGRVVVKRAQGLEMNVIAYDPFISKDTAYNIGIELVEMEELLRRSDYITIHVPKTEGTIHLIGPKEFRMMKKGVRIINCSRGGIVDEEALYQAIVDKRVSGAALDVFEKEPPVDSPLLELDEVICTPHLGASTGEAQENVAIAVAEQIVDFLKRGEIRNAINVPSVDIEVLGKIRPFLSLAEKLGSFQGQLVEGGIREVTVKYSGDVINLGVKIVTVSVLKGLLQVFIERDVNWVNASIIAEERGIRVLETTSSEVEDFTSLIGVKIKTDKEEREIYGTIFGKEDPRIVRVDDYHIEAILSGNMLFFSNVDAPGVIGRIGTVLGNNKINIAGMHLGRTRPQGKAVAIVNIDSPVTEEALKEIRGMQDIISAKRITL